LIGCFNITLYAYFDIHRIFDLIIFRIWDFILWWFDLDFILFDFNFDFILCLSFLFIFLLHFFIKVIFSFLNNFIIFNVLHLILNIFLLYTNYIAFITFLFVSLLFILLNAIEAYFLLVIFIFSDFSGFSDTYIIFNAQTTIMQYTTYFYILFYFIINIVNTYWLLILRFFFSQSYYNISNIDIHLSNKLIDITNISLIKLFITACNYLLNTGLIGIYNYLYIIQVNIIISFLILTMFYVYKVFTFNLLTESFKFLIQKKVNHLYNLNLCYSLEFYRNLFSDITFLFLLNYIIFTINFFSSFIKDFTYINVFINIFTVFLLFSFFTFNFSFNNERLFKKQLIYLMF